MPCSKKYYQQAVWNLLPVSSCCLQHDTTRLLRLVQVSDTKLWPVFYATWLSQGQIFSVSLKSAKSLLRCLPKAKMSVNEGERYEGGRKLLREKLRWTNKARVLSIYHR